MTDQPIQFSIVVPTYNRPQALRRCLESLAEMDYPSGQLEVIVSDDGGARPLDDLVDSFAGRLNVVLVRQDNAGPGPARNAGVAAARGKFLAFTDDDCRPAPDWLKQFELQFQSTPEALLGGRTVNELTDNPYSTTSQLIVDIVYAHYNKNPDDAQFFASNNIAMSADGYRRVGGFDPHWPIAAAEDRELCLRWRRAGGRMIYVPQAVMRHAHSLSLRQFVRQHFRYGRGAYLFHRHRSAQRAGRFYHELGFHLDVRNWLLRPFRQRQQVPAWRVAVLLVLWQTANALGLIYQMLPGPGAKHPATRTPPTQTAPTGE